MTDVVFHGIAPFGQDQSSPPNSATVLPQAQLPRIPPPAPTESAPRLIPPPDFDADASGLDAIVALLAELAAHRGTVAPLTIGIFGGPGAGKSFALAAIIARIRDIAGTAAKAGPGPFLPRIHIQTVDAATLDGDPALALAGQIHRGLRQDYPGLVRDLAQATHDPHVIFRDLEDKLDAARARLDAARLALDDTGSRLARLTETILSDAAGTQIDHYARARRPGLERLFAGFGFRGDAVRNFKDFVAAASAPAGLWGLVPSALFSFKGQKRLIVLAAIFLLAGLGAGLAHDTHEAWLAALREGPAFIMPAETWLSDHVDVLALVQRAAFAGAGLLVLSNLWRAARFLRPVAAGARLMRRDLETRQRDLGGLYAHQTKRADHIAHDVERLSQATAEAERRAGSTGGLSGWADHSPVETSAAAKAQDFFAKLGARTGQPDAPERVILVLDHLEAVPADRARTILAKAHRLAETAGLTILVAADPGHLGAGRADLERWVHVPLTLGPWSLPEAGPLVASRLTSALPPVDPAQSVFGDSLSEAELQLLALAAPLAGGTPRAVKRLAQLYTLARADRRTPRGLLALALAVNLGGTWAERQALASLSTDQPFDGEESPRFVSALRAASSYDGPLSAPDATRALARAAIFQIDP